MTQESELDFKLIEYNPIRNLRGAEAAKVSITEDNWQTSYWLWMSVENIQNNIKEWGPHPELLKALGAYKSNVRLQFEVDNSNAA